jgi:aspartyl-tRNA(Asn)/glutamyl-tRNA(Gln) amidotransferase subunit C
VLEETEILKLCKLSKLSISVEEYSSFIDKLNGLFDWISELKEIDVSGVNLQNLEDYPVNFGEEDEVCSLGLLCNKDKVLNNAPSSKFDMFAVPKVIE